MKAYPAVDLRSGRVVQLVGGVPGTERVVLDDPVATAKHWQTVGFHALHMIDLDAALGQGENRAVMSRVIESVGISVQVGGGVRTTESVDALLAAGANRVIVGTRAVLDRPWLEEITTLWPGRIIVAADVGDETVMVRGWTHASDTPVDAFLESLQSLPLAAVLVTDVRREGRMEGIDEERFAWLARATQHPLIAAGGVARIEDLFALERAGAAGVVLGMALYTGALETAALEEFI